MIVYRICKTYPPNYDPLDGVGAFQKSGRWNSKGTHAVYTASSLSLARAELGRHLDLNNLPDDYRVYEIEVPEDGWFELGSFPNGWDNDPPSFVTQRQGDSILQDHNKLALKVRSVCDPAAFNLVLNPWCRRFADVKIVKDYPFIP